MIKGRSAKNFRLYPSGRSKGATGGLPVSAPSTTEDTGGQAASGTQAKRAPPMADGSNFTFWAWPPPGISAQDTNYNPVTTWWSGVLSQIGFINIKNMNSGDSDLEMRIASEVGSYGRQLGWITDAQRPFVSIWSG